MGFRSSDYTNPGLPPVLGYQRVVSIPTLVRQLCNHLLSVSHLHTMLTYVLILNLFFYSYCEQSTLLFTWFPAASPCYQTQCSRGCSISSFVRAWELEFLENVHLPCNSWGGKGPISMLLNYYTSSHLIAPVLIWSHQFQPKMVKTGPKQAQKSPIVSEMIKNSQRWSKLV